MKIQNLLYKEQDIDLVFLFGSQMRDGINYLKNKKIIPTKNTDLDIGVLLNSDAFRKIKDMYIYHGRLFNLFSDIFPNFNLDIVILNQVSIFIQIEAAKGYKLYQKNQDIYNQYIEFLNKKYNDLNFIRQTYFREMREAILYE
jgi:predicted nucleotidyltransferase